MAGFYRHSSDGTKAIVLSIRHLTTEQRVRDVVAHEAIHAYAGLRGLRDPMDVCDGHGMHFCTEMHTVNVKLSELVQVSIYHDYNSECIASLAEKIYQGTVTELYHKAQSVRGVLAVWVCDDSSPPENVLTSLEGLDPAYLRETFFFATHIYRRDLPADIMQAVALHPLEGAGVLVVSFGTDGVAHKDAPLHCDQNDAATFHGRVAEELKERMKYAKNVVLSGVGAGSHTRGTRPRPLSVTVSRPAESRRRRHQRLISPIPDVAPREHHRLRTDRHAETGLPQPVLSEDPAVAASPASPTPRIRARMHSRKRRRNRGWRITNEELRELHKLRCERQRLCRQGPARATFIVTVAKFARTALARLFIWRRN
jgi:hypothetical protein